MADQNVLDCVDMAVEFHDRMKAYFIEAYTALITRKGADRLLDWLIGVDFFQMTTRPNGIPSAIVPYSLKILSNLSKSPRLKTYGGETMAVCALLHRVGAIPDNLSDEKSLSCEEMSVQRISKYMDLTADEALAIRWQHAYADPGVAGHREVMDDIIRRCPLVLDLNYAITAARLVELNQTLA